MSRVLSGRLFGPWPPACLLPPGNWHTHGQTTDLASVALQRHAWPCMRNTHVRRYTRAGLFCVRCKLQAAMTAPQGGG